MKKGDRKPNCGICNSKKIERNGRLICPVCARRYALDFYHKKPKKPLTDNQKKAKNKNRKKLRPSGLSNQKVYAMKHRYGMSESEFVLLYQKQNKKCAVCLMDIAESETCIDHCHESNVIRGLLCRKCNFAIGLLLDSTNHFESAIKYLNRTR